MIPLDEPLGLTAGGAIRQPANYALVSDKSGDERVYRISDKSQPRKGKPGRKAG